MNHSSGSNLRARLARVLPALVAALPALVYLNSAISADFTFDRAVHRIAFGSCNMSQLAQPIWPAVLDSESDIWIWAGDNIYADTTDIDKMRALYALQNNYKKYRLVRKRMRVLGTWDDHDYGASNSGNEYPQRKASQQALLDFLGEPADSPRRIRKGVYASYLFGPVDRRLKILLLDVRYHRDRPGPETDILGSEQWSWLEAELRRPDANLILIVSGTAILSTEHKGEKWDDYPLARQRLLDVIQAVHVPVILLSGDLHFAEVSKLKLPGHSQPVFEITSSGMTHSIIGAYYPSAVRVGSIYYGLNFGLVDINWGSRSNTVTLQVRDTDGLPRISESVSYKKSAATGE